MLTLADLRPGDLMFGPIGGFVPGVLPVGLGQLLLPPRKERLTWRRWWQIRHAGVVVQAASDTYEDRSSRGRSCVIGIAPLLVEAMPHGAREIEMSANHWTAKHIYIRPMYDNSQGVEVAQAARRYVGTPYNFLTYAALAAGVMGLPDRLLRKWISTRSEMMCSQLADQSLADAGVHVFDDGRLPQDVVPAELFRALLERPGSKYLMAGMPSWAEAPAYWQ